MLSAGRRRGHQPQQIEKKTKLIKKNPSRIQLVPVLNPRVLYYIGQLSNNEPFFEVDELSGLSINEPLLDLCVGILGDDNLVSDKLKKIPVTHIPDISYHIELAFSQLPTNVTFYSALIPVNCTEASDKSSQISANWILYNMIWADNDEGNPLTWENYWDDFHGGYLPQNKDSKIQAEKLLQSSFFKLFVKRHHDFMRIEFCNVRSAVLLAALYENGGSLLDPYDYVNQRNRNKSITASEQINVDFKLEEILTDDWALEKSQKYDFYETMYETMMDDWQASLYKLLKPPSIEFLFKH